MEIKGSLDYILEIFAWLSTMRLLLFLRKIYCIYLSLKLFQAAPWQQYIQGSFLDAQACPTPGITLILAAFFQPNRAQLSKMKRVAPHRRRINTDEKAKVVAAVWRAEFMKIPCRASNFAPGWLEERDEFILFFKSNWCNWTYSSNRPGAFQSILQIVKKSTYMKIHFYLQSTHYEVNPLTIEIL